MSLSSRDSALGLRLRIRGMSTTRVEMAGKKYENAAKKIDRQKRYALDEALELLSANKVANFDETVEMAVRLNVDPRQADQNVRGTVVLPNGTGKIPRVLVLAKGE